MNSEPPPGTRVIPFSIGKIWKDEYGFCHIRLFGGSNKHMGVDEVKEMGKAAFNICEGKKHKHLIDLRGAFGPVLPGAREEVIRNYELNACRSAAAVIVDSMANRMVINFLIQFNKPPYPYRSFDHPDEAVEWLQSL